MAIKPAFSGDLSFLGFGDLLQLLGSNASTGTLVLKSKYIADAGVVHLVNGNPVHATAGSKSGLDGIMALFGWIEGEFSFSPGPVAAEQTIRRNRNAIILDGLQLLDDGQIERVGAVAFKERGAGEMESGQELPLVRGPLVDYMYVVNEEEFGDGKQILTEGSHGKWIWVILDGTVEIIKKTPWGPVRLLRLTSGAYIGSMVTFRPGEYVRGASILAVGNVQLGVMDSQRKGVEFSKMSPEMRALGISLDKRLKQVTSRAADMIVGQPPAPVNLDERQTVIRQGRPDDRLFMIEQGEAEIVASNGPMPLCLNVLVKNDLFGHVPFLDFGHEPHAAGVQSAAELAYRPVDIQSLSREYQRLSTAFKNFFENIATCVAATTKLYCHLVRKAGSDNVPGPGPSGKTGLASDQRK
jgi:CRP-like cAMP-binding protein